MEPDQLHDLLAQCIRPGVVTAREPSGMRVQVRCGDTVTAPLVTDWLQVLTPRAREDCQYDLPDVGDVVLCLFLPHGHESGFVLGCMYAGAKPPVADGDKWHRTFRDGTVLEYDRKVHKLTAIVKGDVDITATGSVTGKLEGGMQAEVSGPIALQSSQQMQLTAPSMTLGGPSGGTTGATMSGTFSLKNGDIIVEGISFRNHVHVCPHGGETGVPQ